VTVRDLRVAPATKLVFKLAFHQASRAGRQTIEAADLFSAIFEEIQGVPVAIVRQHGVEPEVLVSRITARMRDSELREEHLRKRFELPPFLKNFATNLNLLARQDKIAPVFGRDDEIQQVLEILCHRERSNSVMLVGEPGVGKTAIVEGLARRLEFEPESVPLRLRDCQIVNLQMNTMVAGTMLRGMFEDRIQNVIREIKERLIIKAMESSGTGEWSTKMPEPTIPSSSASKCAKSTETGAGLEVSLRPASSSAAVPEALSSAPGRMTLPRWGSREARPARPRWS
jgi:ATP-dependent Clp protease ATP-binding subunit ClpA